MAAKKEQLPGSISFDTTRQLTVITDRDFAKDLSALKITDQASFETTSAIAGKAKIYIKEVTDFWAKDKKLAHELHKSICEKEKKAISTAQAVIDLADRLMRKYVLDQEAESARRQAEIDKAADAARLELTEAAKVAKSEGRMGDARELLEQAATEVVDVSLPVSAPSAPGLQPKRPWIAEITDEMELIRAIASGKVPLEFEKDGEKVRILDWNMPILNFLAKQREKDLRMPGVTAKQGVSFSHSKKADRHVVADLEPDGKDWVEL